MLLLFRHSSSHKEQEEPYFLKFFIPAPSHLLWKEYISQNPPLSYTKYFLRLFHLFLKEYNLFSKPPFSWSTQRRIKILSYHRFFRSFSEKNTSLHFAVPLSYPPFCSSPLLKAIKLFEVHLDAVSLLSRILSSSNPFLCSNSSAALLTTKY